jgi:hypothetical protein
VATLSSSCILSISTTYQRASRDESITRTSPGVVASFLHALFFLASHPVNVFQPCGFQACNPILQLAFLVDGTMARLIKLLANGIPT